MTRIPLLLAGAVALSIAPLAHAAPAAPVAPVVEAKPSDSADPPTKSSAASDVDVGDAPSTLNPEPHESVNDELEAVSSNLALCSSTTKAQLEEQLKAIDDAGLEDDAKKRVVDFYKQAIQSHAVAETQLKTALKFDGDLATLKGPAELKGSLEYSKARLAKSLLPFAETEPVALADVEQWAANNEQWLKTYREELAAADAWLKRRPTRLTELPKLIGDAQHDLKQVVADLAEATGKESPDAVALAQRAALDQRRSELTITVKALELEQRYLQDAAEQFQIDRDHWARKVAQKEKRLPLLRDEINRRREEEARQAAQLAAEGAARARADEAVRARPKALAELADENKVLAERRAKLTTAITEVTHQFDKAHDRGETLEEAYKKAVDQDVLDELSDSVGQLLRQQRAKLPDVRELKRRKAQRDAASDDDRIEYYQLQDERSSMADVDELAEEIIARFGPAGDDVRAEVRSLLEAKRKNLDELMKTYDKKFEELSNLSRAEAKLMSLAEAYGDFIAERVLWIRSCQTPRVADLRPGAAALAWSLNPRHGSELGRAAQRFVHAHPLRLLLGAVVLLGLLVLRRPARRELLRLGEEARKRSCTKLRLTFQALWLTAIMALPWPALLALVGWSLDSPLNESEFVRALSASLRFVALCLLLVELLRHLCRHGGLADAHFDWPQPCLAQLNRKLRWFAALGLPLVLGAIGLEIQQIDPQWSASLGRACFIAAMLVMAVVFGRLLLAKQSPFRQLVIYSSGGWLTPLQIAWRPAIVLMPLALAGLAVAGYYYTAQQASLRLLQTVALVLSVLVLGGLTRRWLLVNRRSLAREQAKLRRAAQQAAAADGEAATTADLLDDSVDLAALSEQTQKLVRTFLAITTTVGFLLIWAEILPALSYLGDAPLIPGAVANENEGYAPLTWEQLCVVLVVLIITYISVRDVPALLELMVLQHLPLDSGFRYAFTSLSRYVIIAVGVSAAFNLMGGQWEKIQWLVAAMSVGLGFGLQEIFANFVSGVILLFERPIRVGDIVTLGDKTGVVNRIRMRATTIVDWDRKEYIVPNKDLITERLLNWTLSDHTNRIEVVTNVASDTDTDVACRLLLEAAREQPHVLAEPSPVAVFESFTDSGLKLVLRCFLPSLENRGATIHGLHTAVDRKFRAAGIESAYGDLRIRVARGGRPASQGADAATSHTMFAAKGDAARRRPDADRQGAA